MKGQILEYKGAKYELHERASISDCGNVYQAQCYKVGDVESENNYPLEVYFAYWKVLESYDPEEGEEDQACDWNEFEII